QAKSVPTEHAAACLNNTTCELVGSIKACPNNQQLFCWIAKTEPSPGMRDAAMAHRGDASGRAHIHTLRSAERDENRRSTPGVRRPYDGVLLVGASGTRVLSDRGGSCCERNEIKGYGVPSVLQQSGLTARHSIRLAFVLLCSAPHFTPMVLT